jgi:hypothetical protein
MPKSPDLTLPLARRITLTRGPGSQPRAGAVSGETRAANFDGTVSTACAAVTIATVNAGTDAINEPTFSPGH